MGKIWVKFLLRLFLTLHYLVIFGEINCMIITFEINNACDGITFISRKQWKARPPKKPFVPIDPVEHVFIHHSELRNCSNLDDCSSAVREIQILHQEERGWIDIGYSWLVGGDGNVYEGRNWDHEGAHTRSFNRNGIGICLLGNYMEILPTKQMLAVTKKLIKCGLEKGKIRDYYHVHGHRDSGATVTDCPGDKLYTEIQQWPRYQKGPLVPPKSPKLFIATIFALHFD